MYLLRRSSRSINVNEIGFTYILIQCTFIVYILNTYNPRSKKFYLYIFNINVYSFLFKLPNIPKTIQ